MKSKFSRIFASILIFALAIGLMPQLTFAQSYVTSSPSLCEYNLAEGQTPYYSYEFLGSRKKMSFKPGELAQITIYIKNTGTIPMFSEDSGCMFRAITSLGTTRNLDRDSILYTELYGEDSRWKAPNRIKLDQKRIDPGEQGTFTFWVKAPHEEGIYREYFDIVIEGKQWLQNDFVMNFDVGEFLAENRENLEYIKESKLVTQYDLNNGKMIEIDISQQRMYLKIGDTIIKNFPVSTGTYRTPTPYGLTSVLFKQEVRVAGAWPHYIMPKWMAFRWNGYGIHALPSISYDNGYYWREALNHIGTRRSHGCIRLLPDDATYAYNFADVGTPVWVHE
jgi:L,D-transpeptidase catalytic domain